MTNSLSWLKNAKLQEKSNCRTSHLSVFIGFKKKSDLDYFYLYLQHILGAIKSRKSDDPLPAPRLERSKKSCFLHANVFYVISCDSHPPPSYREGPDGRGGGGVIPPTPLLYTPRLAGAGVEQYEARRCSIVILYSVKNSPVHMVIFKQMV